MAVFSQWKLPILPLNHKIYLLQTILVEQQRLLHPRSFNHIFTTSAQDNFRCQCCVRLGGSSQAGGTPLSWCLDTRPISSPYQYFLNETIFRAFYQFQKVLSNVLVMISADSASVVAYSCKERGTHSSSLCIEVWKTLLW